jgi:WD40 repeat protein
LWDVPRGKELHRIPAHQQWVSSLSFAPDSKTLASTGCEPVIRLGDVTTGREAFPQSGHRSPVRSQADGAVFTGGYDGTIRRWDPASGRELGLIAQFTDPVGALAVAPDGKTVLVGGSPMGILPIRLWSVAERREIRRFARIEERNPARHVAYSPDGKTVASERRIWDAATGKVLVTFQDRDPQNNHFANFYPIFYSPDSKQIITSEPKGVRIWDLASGQEAC